MHFLLLFMIKIHVENVQDAKYRTIFKNMFRGEYQYIPKGKLKSNTVVLGFKMVEYEVVTDKLLTKAKNELAKEKVTGHKEVYNTLPNPISLEEGEEITVSF